MRHDPDLNGNGAMDIITSTNRGTFWGNPYSARTGAEAHYFGFDL
jgi:hypothetical protein